MVCVYYEVHVYPEREKVQRSSLWEKIWTKERERERTKEVCGFVVKWEREKEEKRMILEMVVR